MKLRQTKYAKKSNIEGSGVEVEFLWRGSRTDYTTALTSTEERRKLGPEVGVGFFGHSHSRQVWPEGGGEDIGGSYATGGYFIIRTD